MEGFFTKFAKAYCGAMASEFWRVGGRPRLIAEIVPREQQIIARHVDCAGVMDSDLIR